MEQDKLSADKLAAIIPHGTGHISAVGRSSGLAPTLSPTASSPGGVFEHWRLLMTIHGNAGSFNGRLRDECLNTNWFISLKDAGDVIEEWRRDYNEVRLHSSLKGDTLKEYAEITAGL